MSEEWKDILGYEGLYQISTLGNIRNKKGEFLKHRTCESIPYSRVALSKDGVVSEFLVHRLVAIAFIDNPLRLPEVNHKDEEKTNNHVDNLEWCSRRYNNLYGNRLNKVKKIINQYSMDGVFIKQWSSGKETKCGGFSPTRVSECCNGKSKHHKRFIWKFDVDK